MNNHASPALLKVSIVGAALSYLLGHLPVIQLVVLLLSGLAAVVSMTCTIVNTVRKGKRK